MESRTGKPDKAPRISGHNLTILGVYHYSSAYPNTKFVIDLFKQSENITCHEISKPLVSQRLRFHQRKGLLRRLLKTVGFLIRAIYCHGYVILCYWCHKKEGVVYIPYPAIGILTIFSFLPRFLLPEKIVADAFISIYDTAVIDRKLLSPSGLAAKLLRALEKRAYKVATITTVDTEENRSYYSRLFNLSESKFFAVPLATDEYNFKYSPYSAGDQGCHVLFVGTFVPLQGTDIIAQTINRLKNRRDIRFTILGSGQSAALFEELIDEEAPTNMNWIKEWQDSATVAKLIHSADICLGIFSGGQKTERVWPFKNYAYMACGRAIITGDTACARRMLATGTDAAFSTIPTGDAQALVSKIEELAHSPEIREQLARNARRYYENYLSNKIVGNKLINDIIFK